MHSQRGPFSQLMTSPRTTHVYTVVSICFILLAVCSCNLCSVNVHTPTVTDKLCSKYTKIKHVNYFALICSIFYCCLLVSSTQFCFDHYQTSFLLPLNSVKTFILHFAALMEKRKSYALFFFVNKNDRSSSSTTNPQFISCTFKSK